MKIRVGRGVLENLLADRYQGALAAVNQHIGQDGTIAGVPAYRRMAEVPFTAGLGGPRGAC